MRPIVLQTQLGLTWIVLAPTAQRALEVDAAYRLGGSRPRFTVEAITLDPGVDAPCATILTWAPETRPSVVEELRRRVGWVARVVGEAVRPAPSCTVHGGTFRLLSADAPSHLSRTIRAELAR